ncbi:MAG: O-antigen ligase family protein, partial [Paracoccaceae bacterium]
MTLHEPDNTPVMPDASGTRRLLRAQIRAAPSYLVVIFLLSLLTPIVLPVGPLLLMPHRIVLIVVFFPLLAGLVTGRAGPVLLIDWLMIFSALWAALALAVNHGFVVMIEAMGIHIVEFFGAYLLGRMAIRSAADFRRFVRTLLFLVLFLLPFAALESVTGRPVLLDLIPNSIRPVDIGARFGLRRAQTVFAHPILYGAFVSTGLGLFWYVLRPTWSRLYSAPAVILSTMFSLSTGALLALVGQIIFIGWEMLTRRISRRWTIFAVLAALAYLTVDLLSNRTPFDVLVTYASFNSGSAYNRILIWQFGTENVWANPIFGLGLGDWARPSWMGASVDNFWLLTAMRYGLPTIISFVLALVLILRRVALAPLTTPLERACRAGYLVAFGGVVLAGSTVHYWQAIA